MSDLKDELQSRIFDILTPEFFISAMQSGQGPEPGGTLGEWVVKVHKDAALSISSLDNHQSDTEHQNSEAAKSAQQELYGARGVFLSFPEAFRICICQQEEI